ncbi:MAG: photosystem II stability/assembly factor-like uncharacterized protein [Saprospiraceae bacterium]|jgi:photosystem II stability/assembly factor-like uncharacterized protein
MTYYPDKIHRLILFFLFLFVLNVVQSQSTEELFSLPGLRFGIDGIDDTGGRYDHSIFYRGDTIYGSEKFLIYQETGGYYFYLKIDNKKLYAPISSVSSENLPLLFDFGLDVGDSFYSASNYYSGGVKVVEKSLITLSDGHDRIKIVLENQTYDKIYTWIEGIGFEELGIKLDYNYWPELKCVSSDGGDIYLSEGFSSEDCDARGCLMMYGNFNITNTIENKVVLSNGSLNYTELRLDMGDGTVFDEFVEEYEYQDNGCYNIELTVTNDCGKIAYKQHFFDYCGDPIWHKKSETKIGGVFFYTAEEGVGVRFDSLFVTADGGQSWQYESSNLSDILVEAEPRAFKFQTNGFGLCSTYNADEGDYCYFITKNGGKHWDRIDNSTFYRVLDINEVGVMLKISAFKVEKSYDFGQTWIELDYNMQSTARKVSMTGDSIISLIEVVKTEEGDVISNFIISKDLGSSWESFLFEDVLRETEVVDDKTWFLAGSHDLYLTEDGGESWNSIFTFYGFDRFATGINFIDSDFGYFRMYRELFRTEDGGDTWSIENCTFNSTFRLFVHENRTSTAMISGDLYERMPNPDYECETVSVNEHDVSGIRVFPNPVSEYLTIKVEDLTNQDEMVVKIYNITGEEVLNESLREVNNVLNLDNILSGIYFYEIIDHQYEIDQGRLVILR